MQHLKVYKELLHKYINTYIIYIYIYLYNKCLRTGFSIYASRQANNHKYNIIKPQISVEFASEPICMLKAQWSTPRTYKHTNETTLQRNQRTQLQMNDKETNISTWTSKLERTCIYSTMVTNTSMSTET
jgi:hypothetical protein